MDDETEPAAQHRMVLVPSFGSKTPASSFLAADNLRVAVVPAARPLAEVAADSADVANLRGGERESGLVKSGVFMPDERVSGQVGHSGQCANPDAVVFFFNIREPRDCLEVDDDIRLSDSFFDFCDQVGPARHEEDFFILPQTSVKKENILEPGEVVKEVKIPLARKGEKSAYYKLKERGTWDFAIVSAAVKALVSGGAFKDVRVVLGGVAPIPWRLKQVENSISGRKASEDMLRKAAKEALREAKPLEENGYKLDLIETAVYRAVLSLA